MTIPPFRFHHTGLLVKSMEAATALQVERYGYRIESPVIHDPVQTAFVRFLRLPGAAHWLELVSPEGERSKLAEALRKRGDGLHHLCYEVDDLDAACAHLRQSRQTVVGRQKHHRHTRGLRQRPTLRHPRKEPLIHRSF